MMKLLAQDFGKTQLTKSEPHVCTTITSNDLTAFG